MIYRAKKAELWIKIPQVIVTVLHDETLMQLLMSNDMVSFPLLFLPKCVFIKSDFNKKIMNSFKKYIMPK